MFNLENEIIEVINDYDNFNFNDVKAIKPYNYKSTNVTTPQVVVQRIYDAPNTRTFTDREEYSDFAYQLTVLSRVQKNKDNETIAPYDVVTEISERLVELMYDKFLMTRNGDFYVSPLSDDNTIMSCAIRFSGVIGLDHEYLYTK